MKKLILLIFLVFLISFVGAYNTEDCEEVYYFIIENVDSNGFIEYGENLNTLSSNLHINNKTLIEDYIENFSGCEKILGLTLPEINKKVNILETIETYEKCDTELNKTILGLDLDDSVWIGKRVVLSDTTCKEISRWKSILSYKQIEERTFVLEGIKIWVFLVLAFIGLILFMRAMLKKVK